MSSGIADWASLPNAAITRTLAAADAVTAANASCVCTQWRSAVRANDLLWRGFARRDLPELADVWDRQSGGTHRTRLNWHEEFAHASLLRNRWRRAERHVKLTTLSKHRRVITGCAFVDGAIVSTSYDNTLVVWEDWNGEVKWNRVVDQSTRAPFTGVCSSRRAHEMFFTHCKDATVHAWKSPNGDMISPIIDPECRDPRARRSLVVHAMAVTDDNSRLFTGHGSGSLCVWDVEYRRLGSLVNDEDAHRGPVFDVALSHAGDIIATASADTCVQLRDTRTPARVVSNIDHAEDGLLAVDFMEGDREMVTGGLEGIARVYDLRMPCAPALTINVNTGDGAGERNWIRAISVYANCAVAFACKDGFVRICIPEADAAAGTATALPMEEHGDERAPADMRAVCVHPSGESIVAGSTNGALYHWRFGKASPL